MDKTKISCTSESVCFEIDFETSDLDDLEKFSIENKENLTVFLPLPSFGVTNSLIDICSDLIDASFVAERLAEFVTCANADYDYSIKHKTRIKLSLFEVRSDIKNIFSDCYVLFHGCDEHPALQEKYDEVRSLVYDYEDQLGRYNPKVPEIVEWYFANLVYGAYYEMQSEAPDFYGEQIKLYPERQAEFFKSPFSERIGQNSYTSQDSWLVPCDVDLNHFFKITGQGFSFGDFLEGSIFAVEGKSFVRTENQIVYFPMNQYFRSRVCVSLIQSEDAWPSDKFGWSDASFTHSPYREHLRSMLSEDLLAPAMKREKCRVHESGALILVDDGSYFHLLYDTKELDIREIKALSNHVLGLSEKLSAHIGFSETIVCEWRILSDEDFEQLCYDVIYAHPKFDCDTIKKLGKSRSRDGGRDIVVYENRGRTGERGRKWIFQCKLITDGSSLTAKKLTDVGDMLEQYDAQGFGVMTSSFIDATLYDKLEKICQKRNIEEMHYSVFELERFLARNLTIRKRYFKS